MIYADARVSKNQWGPGREPVCSQLRVAAYTGPPVEYPLPRSRSAKWGSDDNIACYSQEKKKLWVNIVICLVSRLTLTLQNLQSLSRIKCESYILIKKYCPASFITLDNMGSVQHLLIAIAPRSSLGVVVSVRVPSMSKIYRFKN